MTSLTIDLPDDVKPEQAQQIADILTDAIVKLQHRGLTMASIVPLLRLTAIALEDADHDPIQSLKGKALDYALIEVAAPEAMESEDEADLLSAMSLDGKTESLVRDKIREKVFGRFVELLDINEMLGTKTRALMQREQGRDLFDLSHAWQLSQAGQTAYRVDGKKAMQAFTWYLEKEGAKIGADEANALLDVKMRKKGFRTDMDTLLRPGLPKFDVDAASALIRASYFSHLP